MKEVFTEGTRCPKKKAGQAVYWESPSGHTYLSNQFVMHLCVCVWGRHMLVTDEREENTVVI